MNDGGPAFPIFGGTGISKRELFAIVAMNGVLSDPNCGGDPEDVVPYCLAMADEFIVRLAKDEVT